MALAPCVPRIRPGTIARLERREARIQQRLDMVDQLRAEMAIDQEITDYRRAMTWWEKRR